LIVVGHQRPTNSHRAHTYPAPPIFYYLRRTKGTALSNKMPVQIIEARYTLSYSKLYECLEEIFGQGNVEVIVRRFLLGP
jgi:hypothetical protein